MPERVDPLATADFTELLHELRGRELERVPDEGGAVLSGGCAGAWYFDWFAGRYRGTVERHIGVEAYSPRPDDLPAGAEWLDRTLGDLAPVAEGSVDLVFAGQTVEHLWPREIADFLRESHRVLRPGGLLVLDSPNRLVTQALAIVQPEHTLELAVDEAAELVELAGFELAGVRGLWHCYDRERRRLLAVEDLAISPEARRRRIEEAGERPEESFVWWLEARRGDRAPRPAELEARVHELGDRFRTVAGGRMCSDVGTRARSAGDEPLILTRQGEGGAALYGPFVPMPAGRFRARFSLGPGEGPRMVRGTLVAVLQVTAGRDAVPLRELYVMAEDLPPDGTMRSFALDFSLDDPTTMGLQTRVIAMGPAALAVRARVPVEPQETARDDGDPTPAPHPSPTRTRSGA